MSEATGDLANFINKIAQIQPFTLSKICDSVYLLLALTSIEVAFWRLLKPVDKKLFKVKIAILFEFVLFFAYFSKTKNRKTWHIIIHNYTQEQD